MQFLKEASKQEKVNKNLNTMLAQTDAHQASKVMSH
jgi:hypothetical protein